MHWLTQTIVWRRADDNEPEHAAQQPPIMRKQCDVARNSPIQTFWIDEKGVVDSLQQHAITRHLSHTHARDSPR
jgi:hypothetical protein